MKIYTKQGDKGSTSLIGGTKIEKDSIRVEAYGTIDELNSYIGLCVNYLEKDEDKEVLRKIQKKLFDVGAELSTINYERYKNITKEEDSRQIKFLYRQYIALIEQFENVPVLRYNWQKDKMIKVISFINENNLRR